MNQQWVEHLLDNLLPVRAKGTEEDREWARDSLPHLPQPPYQSRDFTASKSTLRATEALLEDKKKELLSILVLCRDLQDDIWRQRAACSPTRRLPSEILTNVFSCILDTSERPGPELMRGARLVCRRWNGVAVASPCLWTNIVLNLDVQYCSAWVNKEKAVLRQFEIASLSVSRSSTLPLSVRANFGQKRHSEAFWKQIGGFFKSIPRWTTFSYCGHRVDFERIFKQLEQPRLLEKLSFCDSKFERFAEEEQDTSAYVDGAIIVFDSLRRLELFKCSLSHSIRFTGQNVTTICLEEVSLTVHDYLALSQDTANVKFLLFTFVTWYTSDTVLDRLDANKFGHRDLVKLSWRGILVSPLMDQDLGDLAEAIIFNYILSQAAGVQVLDVTWDDHFINPSVLLQTAPRFGAVEDLFIENLFLGSYSNCAFRTWISNFEGLQYLSVSFDRSGGPQADTELVEALYNDPLDNLPPKSSVLTNPQLEKIVLRNSRLHVTALWGLHRACKSTIPLGDHFLDRKSKAIEWPRDKSGDLVDLSEAAGTLVDSKLLRFVVN